MHVSKESNHYYGIYQKFGLWPIGRPPKYCYMGWAQRRSCSSKDAWHVSNNFCPIGVDFFYEYAIGYIKIQFSYRIQI